MGFIATGWLALVPLLLLLAAAEGSQPPCQKNEVFMECGPSCDAECRTLNEPCLVRHIRCPDGCFCAEGFARNANGKCVPEARCPPKTRS